MSEKCHATPKRNDCETEQIKPQVQYTTCPPFTVCLPFGKTLRFDGNCFHIEGNPTVVDGTYGQIVVQDGCIVDALPNPAFEYTPPPCSPAAKSCNEQSSSGTAATVVLDPSINNLLRFNSSGQLGAVLVVRQGNGIDVTGSGSSSDPLVISLEGATGEGGGGGAVIQSDDPSFIAVDGTGTASDPVRLTAQKVIAPKTYGNFTIDEYGRVTAVDEANTRKGITSITAGPGIDVSQAGTTATIALPSMPGADGTYVLGAFRLTANPVGLVSNVSQLFTTRVTSEDFEPVAGDGTTYQVIDPMHNELTISEYGSIAAVHPIQRGGNYTNHTAMINTVATARSLSMTMHTTVAGRILVDWEGKKETTSNWLAWLSTHNLSASLTNNDTNKTYALTNAITVQTCRFRAISDDMPPGTYTINLSCKVDLGVGTLEAEVIE